MERFVAWLRDWFYRTVGTQVAVLGILATLAIAMLLVECGIVIACRKFGKCCLVFGVLLANFALLFGIYYQLVPPLVFPLPNGDSWAT